MLPHKNKTLYFLFYRAFTAYEEGSPVDQALEHRERTNLLVYKKKFETYSISDPLEMKTGWIGENTGMLQWPKIYFMDISRYFSSVISREDLWQRLECEYKEGKAYRYFTNGFIGEILINNISDESKLCILKTKCVPSQRVSARQYDVWVIVRKDQINGTSGEILGGYCTCTAGLLGKY